MEFLIIFLGVLVAGYLILRVYKSKTEASDLSIYDELESSEDEDSATIVTTFEEQKEQ